MIRKWWFRIICIALVLAIGSFAVYDAFFTTKVTASQSFVSISLVSPLQAPIEMPNLRTATSKTFDLGNGKHQLVCYGNTIHYKDSNNAWQDPDPAYSESDTGDYTAKFTKLPYLIRMGDDGTRRIYPDRNDLTYWIDIGKPFASMGTPTKQGNTWTWDFPNASINITLGTQIIKFTFILKNSSAPTSITIPFSATGITRTGNNLIHNGQVVAILLTPNAVDANGTERTITVTFGSGNITLSLSITGLVFPITVDPSPLIVQPSAKDTYLYQYQATLNAGSETDLELSNRTSRLRHNILEFDISALPASQTLTSALLDLYYFMYSGTDPVGKTVWMYKQTRTNWVETEATWNIYKTGSNWTTAGGDYVTDTPSGGSTTFPANRPAWMEWNVLAICQDAYAGSIAAEFLQRFETEGLSSGYTNPVQFYTREYTTDTTKCPKLTIAYESAVTYAISESPTTWLLNGITGSGKANINTTYYANPLGDTTAPSATVAQGECQFLITNTSTGAIDLTANMSDMSGGSDNSTNSNSGSNGATSFGAYCWYKDETYTNKQVMATSSATGNLYSNLGASTNLYWGAEVKTQSNAWTGGTSAVSTILITASPH